MANLREGEEGMSLRFRGCQGKSSGKVGREEKRQSREEQRRTWKNSPTFSFFAPPLINFLLSTALANLNASSSRLSWGVRGVAGMLNHFEPAVWGCFCEGRCRVSVGVRVGVDGNGE